jgi:cytochrome c
MHTGAASEPGQSPIITTAVIGSGSTAVVNPAIPLMATKEELVSFVNEVETYAKPNGNEKALAEFSNKNGLFFRGKLDIYACDTNRTPIATPANPEKIGVNRLNKNDAEGNLSITELRSAAMNGTGVVMDNYINPSHDNAIEKKLGYTMSVDPTWWLGSVYIRSWQKLR